MSKKLINSNGKLLLFGEYAVIDGATALAIPCRYGQSLTIKPHRGSDLIWTCLDENGEKWFEAQISLYDFSSIRTTDEEVSKFIQKLLKATVQYNTEFLNKWNGFKAIHKVDFNRMWGLGTSSTLINNIATWADINPFHLHFEISNGSGYDIACASAEYPIQYRLGENELNLQEVDFDPSFSQQIYFVYLGQKQDSKAGIAAYRKQKRNTQLIDQINEISKSAINCNEITAFMELMYRHEQIIAEHLAMDTVQKLKFKDFQGQIKSLGAWGGDFVMAVSDTLAPKDIVSYFNDKGYKDVIAYNDMIYTPTPSSTQEKPISKAS